MSNQPHVFRIVIADEQPLVRVGLRRLLESDAGLSVVGEAPDANDTVELVRQIKPDIVLVDLDLWRELKLHAPGGLASSSPLRIVAMVSTVRKADIVEAFLLGAHGIILKTSTPRILFKSIRGVMAGQYWLEHESLGILVEALREVLSQGNGSSSPKDYGLTRRELDIIDKIVNGRSNREVGEDFSISERTVKHHLTNIFSKVGVTSRLQLALFAVNHHLTRTQVMSTHAPLVLLQPMRSEKEA
jgi:two-component system nitrate/nitrite response regulator NarL